MEIELILWGTAKSIELTAEISICPADPETGTAANDLIESVTVWRGNKFRKLNPRKISEKLELAIWEKLDQEIRSQNEE